MAQNNMEKDFGKKLNEREIQPSPMAWDRLDAMLSVAEQKKPEKKYNWLYVAAGFLGFLFIGMMLFNQTQTMTDAGNNQVVVEDASAKDATKEIQQAKPLQPIQQAKTQHTAVAFEQKIKSKTAAVKTTEPARIIKKQIENQNQDQSGQHAIAAQNNNQEHIINQKTEQLKKFNYVDVDELLASVDKTPKKKEASVRVDSNSLLTQVDGELELSFREKVIKTVSRNFNTVKVALSNRNVQQ